MKLQLLCLALCSLAARAVYVTRLPTISRMKGPTAFRPGVRPSAPRLVQGPSRGPYVLYRGSPPQRYIKQGQSTRNVYDGQATRTVYAVPPSGPWKTTRPYSPPQEYEFVRAASSTHPLRLQPNGGAIHTIPAPNLSLAEKPIVVMEMSEKDPTQHAQASTDSTNHIMYEVTEKFPDPIAYQMGHKVLEATPIGFSKPSSQTHELDNLVRNGAAMAAADYGLSAFAVPQPAHHVARPQPAQPVPVQGFHGIQHPQEFMQPALDGYIIPPNALYQHDPSFLQKIQNQLLQRFPGVEFVPYNAPQDLQPQVSTQAQFILLSENNHIQQQIHPQQQIHQLQQQIHQPQQIHQQQMHRPQQQIHQQQQQIHQPQQQIHQPQQQIHQPQHHLSVIPLNTENHKNVVRETQESHVVTSAPQPFVNATEKVEIITVNPNQNVTITVVEDSQPSTSTVKYVVEASTEEQKTTPIFYAQIGQTIGTGVANGLYSAINDVRAAAALAQVSETPQPVYKAENKDDNATTTTTSTTTMNPDLSNYFVIEKGDSNSNQTITDVKPLLGVPFAKVAYTIVRSDEKDAKVNKDGSVYAGQLVEATISEDQDFNKQKADLMKRAPIRLMAEVQKKETQQPSSTTPKLTVVKAKIPPKSKLTFDAKTGEPVLRIYASYMDTPLHKEIIASKLSNIKHVKEVVARKQDATVNAWKSGNTKNLDKREQQLPDPNRVTQFGLKLKSRIDDVQPIFDDYEE